MPIIKSAIKRMKQTQARRARNVAVKRDLKSAVKAFVAKPSAKALAAAQSEIDTAVKKNILNKNTAARRKSSLARIAREAGVKLEASTAKKAAAKPATKKTTAKKSTPKKTTATATKKSAAKKAPAKKTPSKK